MLSITQAFNPAQFALRANAGEPPALPESARFKVGEIKALNEKQMPV